jgi:hypothetical protein
VGAVTEGRYLELLEAAPPIKRDEITRVSQYQPDHAAIAVAVLIALGQRPPRPDWS